MDGPDLWGSSRDDLYVLDVGFKEAVWLNEGEGVISDRGICHGDVLPNEKHGLLTRDRSVARGIVLPPSRLTSAMLCLLTARKNSSVSPYSLKRHAGDVAASVSRLTGSTER